MSNRKISKPTKAKAQSSIKSSGQLILKKPELRRRTTALFDKIENDQAQREAFLRNPVGVLSRQLMGRKLETQQESDANRLLLSVLSNEEFSIWLRKYKPVRDGKNITREQFAKDFAQALVKFGDSVIVNAALQNVANGFDLVGPVAQQFVTGPDKSVVTSPATPSTSAQDLRSSQNFNGFGLKFGDSLVIQPALFRSLTEQLIGHAKSLRETGALADLNAEIR